MTVYSPNMNFHVYDASMYPDLNPYPAIPSACGDNDPDCTQLCAQHPEANIHTIRYNSSSISRDRPPSPPGLLSPPEAPAHRHKGLSDGVMAGIVVGGVIVGGSALGAAWCCYRKREDCIQSMRDMRDRILELCGGKRRPVVEPISAEQNPSPDGRPGGSSLDMPVRPLKYIQITDSLWKDPRNDQSERQKQEVRPDAGPSSSTDDLSSEEPVRPLKYIQITDSLWKDPRNDQSERQRPEVRS